MMENKLNMTVVAMLLTCAHACSGTIALYLWQHACVASVLLANTTLSYITFECAWRCLVVFKLHIPYMRQASGQQPWYVVILICKETVESGERIAAFALRS